MPQCVHAVRILFRGDHSPTVSTGSQRTSRPADDPRFTPLCNNGGIILYTIVKLGEGGDVCSHSINEMSFIPLNISSEYLYYSNTSRGFGDLSKIVFHFDAVGWLVSIPIFAYGFMYQQGVPGLTHPIREKHLLRQFMAAIFGIVTISYLSLGVVVPLWFKATIQETCTLNWVSHK